MSTRLHSKADFDRVRKEIKDSEQKDYKDWVNEHVSEMERAHSRGNFRKIFTLVNKLSRKPKPPPQNLTTDKDGKLLESAEATAERWLGFLRKKFEATKRERDVRPAMPEIPSFRSRDSALTRKEFEDAVTDMPNFKATGPDRIPAELIKYCPNIREVLFFIVERIWNEEKLPEGFAEANFVLLFKNKGSPNDPTKYRCIALLNHAYKILSKIILVRLTRQCGNFLDDSQAGFRRGRGCRDNTLILRTLVQKWMQLGRKIALVFIDYSAAFDTVSHKFLDTALKEAKASNKLRALFRVVYAAASDLPV